METRLKDGFSLKALEDFRLVDLAIGGDEHGYTKLFSLYKHTVYYMVIRLVRNEDDADDITMEAFFKAFRSLGQFKKEFAFSTWLFRIATNSAIDFLRKKRLNTLSISDEYTEASGQSSFIDVKDMNPNPQEKIIKKQKQELIQLVVAMLPKKYQQLVRLRYFEEFSYEEIVNELNLPLGTVKAQLYRSRELIYKLMESKRKYM